MSSPGSPCAAARSDDCRENRFLYENGAKEVHMRSACPPIMYSCKFLNFSRATGDMDLLARRVIFELEGEKGFSFLEEYSDPDTERGKALRKAISKKVLKKVVLVMGIAVIAGLFVKRMLASNVRLFYFVLGCIVVLIALSGLVKLFKKAPERQVKEPVLTLLLLSAGIVHGMYVCGGPLLIAYMSKKLPEKSSFRATISTTWIFLNGIIFLSHILNGSFTPGVIRSSLISVPFLLAGMFLGSVLYKRMTQSFFIRLTYVLLLISGISLFFK